MRMEANVLNRLVAARHLIETSGPPLTASSPALLVAQKLLLAHDASELTFLALCSSHKVFPQGSDGQRVKEPSFVRLAESVINHAIAKLAFIDRSSLKLFYDLTEARKLFKHGGVLVDPLSNAPIFQNVVVTLDELCTLYVGEPLLTIDQSSVILSEGARNHFVAAKNAIEVGDFKGSLERTAKALADALWDLNLPGSPTVGKPSSEEALLLSGQGIDPAAFLSMQQFLPLTYMFSDEQQWDLREYGHSANWSEDTSRLCLETAIGAVVKLQAAPLRPTATKFYDKFEDVVEIVVDKATAYWVKSNIFGSSYEERTLPGFTAGERLFGRASGRVKRTHRLTEDTNVGLEYGEWVAIEQPRSSRIAIEDTAWGEDVVWLLSKEVSVSYQTNQRVLLMREHQKSEQDYEGQTG